MPLAAGPPDGPLGLRRLELDDGGADRVLQLLQRPPRRSPAPRCRAPPGRPARPPRRRRPAGRRRRPGRARPRPPPGRPGRPGGRSPRRTASPSPSPPTRPPAAGPAPAAGPRRRWRPRRSPTPGPWSGTARPPPPAHWPPAHRPALRPLPGRARKPEHPEDPPLVPGRAPLQPIHHRRPSGRIRRHSAAIHIPGLAGRDRRGRSGSSGSSGSGSSGRPLPIGGHACQSRTQRAVSTSRPYVNHPANRSCAANTRTRRSSTSHPAAAPDCNPSASAHADPAPGAPDNAATKSAAEQAAAPARVGPGRRRAAGRASEPCPPDHPPP